MTMEYVLKNFSVTLLQALTKNLWLAVFQNHGFFHYNIQPW